MKKLVYLKDGIWQFWHDTKKGICNQAPNASEESVLFADGQADFAVSCSEDGVIYLICQDFYNTIYLFFMEHGNWNKKRLLESKNQVYYEKHFQLLCIGGWLNCFYTIRHQEQTMLIYHVLNSENEPVVLATQKAPFPFFVTQDMDNNLYCVYQSEGIGYQRFVWKEKRWESFRLISKTAEPLSSVCAMTDFAGKLHIVACFGKERSYRAAVICESSETELIDGSVFPLQPILLFDRQFYVLFSLGGRVLQCESLNGETFSAPRYYYPGSFSRQQLYELHFVKDIRRQGIIAPFIYGNENSGVFTPLLIEEHLKSITFSDPVTVTEKKPDIEAFVEETQQFEKELGEIQAHLTKEPSLDMLLFAAARIEDLENRIMRLEQKLPDELSDQR